MKEFCDPAPEGCRRCQPQESNCDKAAIALLLGPQDADADAALRQLLEAKDYSFFALGPVLVLPDVSARLPALRDCLNEGLSTYTQQSVRAAYAQGGATTLEDALNAFLFAEPLPFALETMQHEWARQALRDNWLFSVFHPIIAAQTGEIFAYEALLRARNPQTQAIIGAGEIIQACEKLNLQHQLDQTARRTAIHNAADLKIPAMRCFINFLPNTIYDPKICLRTTMQAAQEAGFESGKIVFEVVETEQIPDMKRLRYILDYYRERGVGTAVDDMGAGFTSVEYLTALQPDYVKLDRDVVVEAAQSPAARRSLDSIVALARRLNIRVIAEGIETPHQMQICAGAGVDYLQGFLFARPANPPQAVNVSCFQALAKAA